MRRGYEIRIVPPAYAIKSTMSDYWEKELLVLGCGNVLFGDDGFGPAVAEYLQHHCDIPSNTCVMNAGLGVRDVLFNIALSEKCPRMVILVDAVDAGRPAGEVRQCNIREIAARTTGEQSMHFLPTTRLLRELRDARGIEVEVISVQPHRMPQEVSPGLSAIVTDAIPGACQKILEMLARPRDCPDSPL